MYVCMQTNYLNDEEGFWRFNKWSPDNIFGTNISNLARKPFKMIHLLEGLQKAEDLKNAEGI